MPNLQRKPLWELRKGTSWDWREVAAARKRLAAKRFILRSNPELSARSLRAAPTELLVYLAKQYRDLCRGKRRAE